MRGPGGRRRRQDAISHQDGGGPCWPRGCGGRPRRWSRADRAGRWIVPASVWTAERDRAAAAGSGRQARKRSVPPRLAGHARAQAWAIVVKMHGTSPPICSRPRPVRPSSLSRARQPSRTYA